MKPVLIVDRDGALSVLKTVRGRKKSLKSLVEYVEEHVSDPSRQDHGDLPREDRESLEFTEEMLLSAVQPESLWKLCWAARSAPIQAGVSSVSYSSTRWTTSSSVCRIRSGIG